MERLLAIAVLASAALRVLGMAALPAVRRELRAHPTLALAAAGGALAALGVVGWAITGPPWRLRILVVLVVLGWAVLALRARPSYGQRRRLPPGSLGLRSSLHAIVQPRFYADAARHHGAIFKMAQFHRPVACIVGIEQGRRLLREHGEALVPPPLPLSAAIPRGFLRYMSPVDHAHYAHLFRTAVSEATLRAIEPFALATTAVALAALAADSARAAGGAVRPQAAIERYLRIILLRLYFGALLRVDDEAVIVACERDADVAGATGAAAPRAVRALRRFEALIAERAAVYDAARHDPSIWGGLVRLEADAAHEPTIVGNLFVLLQASQHSIGGMLQWMLVLMSGAPAWRAEMRSRAPTAEDDPYARVVLETLRLAQSEYVYREVRRSLPIDGFVIPAGWMLRICVAESHRDAGLFPEPDRFDPERHRLRRYGANELSPFGLDQHACLGARMTLLLGSMFARQLVHDYDWDVVADGPKERGNRHWHHWQPSSRFQIAFRRCGEWVA